VPTFSGSPPPDDDDDDFASSSEETDEEAERLVVWIEISTFRFDGMGVEKASLRRGRIHWR
jgi:hypothetical protein